MPARPHREEGAVAAEPARVAEAVGERLRVVPDEVLVAENVQDERKVGDGDDARRLGPAPVVVAVRAVQRDREEAAGLPFKGVPLARRGFDARAAAPGEDVHDLFVEMPLRRGLATRRNLNDLHIDEVASPGEVRERALRLEARPRRDVETEKIQAKAFVDRDPLLRDPILVWVDEEARLVHRATFSRAASGARRWPHFLRVSRLVWASGPIAMGNLSRHSHGRVASMIIRELWPLTSGAMAGSSGPDQARLMMSSERSGSERVTTAHMTSLMSVTSMSSSTTMTMRPR